ncbi:hypothetical protein V2G26_020061 [Clonostachys chloroleuca]
MLAQCPPIVRPPDHVTAHITPSVAAYPLRPEGCGRRTPKPPAKLKPASTVFRLSPRPPVITRSKAMSSLSAGLWNGTAPGIISAVYPNSKFHRVSAPHHPVPDQPLLVCLM